MEMVEIQILDKKKVAKALIEKSGQVLPFGVRINTLSCPSLTLDLLDAHGIKYRRMCRNDQADKSVSQMMWEGLVEYAGRLVVQKLAQSETVAIQHLSRPETKISICRTFFD